MELPHNNRMIDTGAMRLFRGAAVSESRRIQNLQLPSASKARAGVTFACARRRRSHSGAARDSAQSAARGWLSCAIAARLPQRHSRA
jgi:hypothetical protein